MASFAEKALEALEAAIENRASQSTMSLQVGGKAISMMSLVEMLDAHEKLSRMVTSEKRHRTGVGLLQTVQVRV